MAIEDLRGQSYDPLEWEDRVLDKNTGDVLVEGTPVNEINLNRMESGIMLSHYDIGLGALTALQCTGVLQKEIEKYKKQRILQGQATITNTANSPYFRSADPFVLVSISDEGNYRQINAPNYSVLINILTADDLGKVGELVVYDKTQNGFKVKMTGTAKSVSFMWTLFNPKV